MNAADLKAMAKKQPIGVVCGVIALACAVLLYMRSDKVEENRNLSGEKAKAARAILTNVANSKDLPQQTEAMQRAVKDLEGRLIHASQLAINLQYFYRLESETSVKLVDVHQGATGFPRAGSGKAGYTAITFAINIQGNFKQVLDFIQRIENGPRIARFNSVSFIKAAGENVGADQFSVSMGIEFLGRP
jgi:Tfp pilus assembly protein PilO